MTEEIRNLYDSIDSYAVQTLVWIHSQHENVEIKSINLDNPEHLWFLSILKHAKVFDGLQPVFSGNFFTYLYLKYIKKVSLKRKPKDSFIIDIDIFNKEITGNFSNEPSILKKIYETNYRR